MRIGILTYPFHNNYGCLLQAYALQKVLKNMGHDVITIDLKSRQITWKGWCYTLLKRISMKLFCSTEMTIYPWANERENKIISYHTNCFIREHIETTQSIHLPENIAVLNKYNFDVLVIGSDQCWRPKYIRNIEIYFCSFLKRNSTIKRISYAVSFGVDYWEYTFRQTKKCKELLKRFSAIGVREDSAVELCRKYLDAFATQVLDPTLLLSGSDYISIAHKEKSRNSSRTIMVHVLDMTTEKKDIINKVAQYKSLTPNYVKASATFSDVGREKIIKCIFPSVSKWLQGYIDAEYVITDSFHGAAFSIIFNKQFIVIANKKRGLTRFLSLLKIFKLEKRLVYSFEEVNEELLESVIDYTIIEEIRGKEISKSVRFLSNALSNE